MAVMRSVRRVLWPLGVLVILGCGGAWHLHRYPAYLRPTDRVIVIRWLLRHPGYRLARPADCGDCAAQINELRGGREPPDSRIPDFTPYYARGDFNRDGIPDLAVAVIDDSTPDASFNVLIFNGPLEAMRSAPVFVSESLDLRGGGLFFFPDRRDLDNALLAGPFNSDNTVLFQAQGDSYATDYGEDEEEPEQA
jgi:hypothetical protein